MIAKVAHLVRVVENSDAVERRAHARRAGVDSDEPRSER